MFSATKILGGLAVAGLVAVGGSAFTATGLSTSGSAAADQFVGGQVSQSVTGGVLSAVAYTFSDAPANTNVSSVELTFAGADAEQVGAVGTGGTPAAFTCTDIALTKSVCTAADPGYTGLTSLAVTVS